MKKFIWISVIGVTAFTCAFFYGYKNNFNEVSLQEKETSAKVDKVSTGEKKSEVPIDGGQAEAEGEGKAEEEKTNTQVDQLEITAENYKEKVVDRILEYIDKRKEEAYGMYSFSKQIGKELKWGFKDKGGNVIVEAQHERVYTDWENGIFGIANEEKYQFINLKTKTIQENKYDHLIFNSEDIELGMIYGEENREIVLTNKKNGEKKIFKEGYLDYRVYDKIIEIIQGEKKTYINHDGTILGNEKNVEFQRDFVVCVKRDGKTHIYLRNGEYLGWTKLDYFDAIMDVEIARFQRDGATCDKERKIKFNEGDEPFYIGRSDPWEYLGDGIVKHMKDRNQGDYKLKIYALKNLKTGKETEEIYHQALRIDENKIFGVTPTSIQILDDDLNVIEEKNSNYYMKYLMDGNMIIGENEDIYYSFMDKNINILWQENRALISRKECEYSGYKYPKYIEYFMIHSLQKIEKEVFFEDGYEKVDKYINEKIVSKVYENSKPLFYPREEGYMRWHLFNSVLSNQVGDVVIIYNTSRRHLYGGGHMGGGRTEIIYITKSGYELDKKQLMLEGWEIKAEEIFKRWFEEKDLRMEAFNPENLDFILEEDGIRFKKKSYYRGIGDYMIDIKLTSEDMEDLIDTQSELYKLAYN